MIHRMKRLTGLFKNHENRLILKIMVLIVFLFEWHPDKHSNLTTNDESMKGGDRRARRSATVAVETLQFLVKKLKEQRPWEAVKMDLSWYFRVLQLPKNYLRIEGEK
jgi:hypothetical protein